MKVGDLVNSKCIYTQKPKVGVVITILDGSWLEVYWFVTGKKGNIIYLDGDISEKMRMEMKGIYI